jgi:multiple sugar transport system permease protein
MCAVAATSRRPPSRSLRASRWRSRLRTLAFLSPWLLGTGLFFGYPLVATAYFSLMKYDGFTPPEWTGLSNWDYVFTVYPFFWPALRNTLWLVFVVVTLRVLFGLAIGLLVVKLRRSAGLFRTLYYAPHLAPPVAATMAFVFLLNPGTGPVNTILDHVGLPQPGWYNDPSWSKPALTLLVLWGVGDLMIIFMAARLDVPVEQYEAAGLDGAGAFSRFRYVTLPNIRPIMVFAAVTGVIQTMQLYTEPLVAGKVASGQIGGPGQQFEPGYPSKSTLTLPQLVYNLGFQRFDIGAACVVALVLFALSMVFAIFLMRRGSAFLGATE